MFDNFDMSAPLSEKLSFGLQVSGFGILVVFLLLIILAVCVMILSKVIRAGESIASNNNNNATVAPATAPAPVAPVAAPLPATQSTGSLDLTDVDEPTAAVIMAIVSNESGIPLNRLMFKSIKKVD